MAHNRGKRSNPSSKQSSPNARGARGPKSAKLRLSGDIDSQRASKLRLISGTHRGRVLVYKGDPVTRPMKDRTREALFSRLGGKFDGGIAIDLFAGTGVLAFESISRGATEGWMIELDPRAAADMKTTAKQLGLEAVSQIRCGNTFDLAGSLLQHIRAQHANSTPVPPWLVFICPPYALWEEQTEALEKLLQQVCSLAPTGSLITVELEEKTPTSILPSQLEWDVRLYRPAHVAIAEIET